MSELSDICRYCGIPASPRFALCGHDWSRLPGELMDRVSEARGKYGEGSERFQMAVEGCLKYLIWLDHPEGE